MVVERALTGGGVWVEQTPLTSSGHRHSDGAGQALAERAGGDLDALGVSVLGVGGGLGAPGAQGLQVGELQAVAGEIKLDVEGQARVPAGQDEPVAPEPLVVGGVVSHQVLEQGIGHRRQAHRRAGVSAADLLHRIGCQQPGGVDGAQV